MARKLSGWGVTTAGLLLAGGGAYAMWTGWDMILLERGWSLFISGAVAISGGVVTMALGRVIAQIARLADQPVRVAVPQKEPEREKAAPVSPAAPPPPPRPEPAPAPSALSNPFEAVEAEPTEVDRYTAGDATYVMLSDGSVEVRSADGAQRYPSLAALRAEAESRHRG